MIIIITSYVVDVQLIFINVKIYSKVDAFASKSDLGRQVVTNHPCMDSMCDQQLRCRLWWDACIENVLIPNPHATTDAKLIIGNLEIVINTKFLLLNQYKAVH